MWGLRDINKFYMLISNRHNDEEGAPCKSSLNSLYEYPMYFVTVHWQIKEISVDRKYVDDDTKSDKIIFTITHRKSINGFSTLLWEV